MSATTKRKTSLTLDAAVLDNARMLGINVSSIAEAALAKAVAEARRKAWLTENAEAFAAQSEWHERNGHPLADIFAGPGGATWKA
jgi:antitoxin CcdA